MNFEIFNPIFTAKKSSSRWRIFLIKTYRYFIERKILDVHVNCYRVHRKLLANICSLVWGGFLKFFKLLCVDTGSFLQNGKYAPIHFLKSLYIICLINIMRNNYLMGGTKPEGFIVRKSQHKNWINQQRTLSMEQPVPHNIDIVQNEEEQNPQEQQILKKKAPRKLDQQSFHNQDVYKKHMKSKSTVNYEEAQTTIMPVMLKDKESKVTPVTNNSRMSNHLKSIEEEKPPTFITNVHGQFDLENFQQIYQLLKNVIHSFAISQVELVNSIGQYFKLICKHNVDDVSDMKFLPTQIELLRQAFAKEREAVLAVCLTVAVGKMDKMRNFCSNLLKYAFENNLLCLNLLTSQSKYIESIIRSEGKSHLLGKGFEKLRTMNEMINDLIVKVCKTDPLFAKEYFRIIDSHSSSSIKTLLYALLSFFAFYINAIKAQHAIPFLATAPGPFIIESTQHEYTLVIDFVRVFTDQSQPRRRHGRYKDRIDIRPYAYYFLREMSKYYEIVSFSDSMPVECNKIINKADELGVVKHRMFKYHIDPLKNRKEMDKIGRNIDKMVLVDTISEEKNKNLLLINSWKGQQSDAQLAEISPLLAMIAVKRLPALKSLQKIRQAATVNTSLGLKYINCGFAL